MMSSRAVARSATLLLIGAALAGCAGFRTPNFFGLGHNGGPKQRAAEGQRIPVLGSTDALAVSPALAGVSFSIPTPAAMTAWPVPGGTPEQSVENVAAGSGFRIAWRKNIGAGATRSTDPMASPIEADGHLFTLDGKAGLDCLDESGRVIWRDTFYPRRGRDTEAYGGGIAYADGTIFITSGYRFIAAVDARTGAVKWRVDTVNPIHGAPNVANGKVFAVDVIDQLYALDTATGQSAWTYQALAEPARILAASSPAVYGEALVAAFASGELVALQRRERQRAVERRAVADQPQQRPVGNPRHRRAARSSTAGTCSPAATPACSPPSTFAPARPAGRLPISTTTTPLARRRRGLCGRSGRPARLHRPRLGPDLLDPRPRTARLRSAASAAPRSGRVRCWPRTG